MKVHPCQYLLFFSTTIDGAGSVASSQCTTTSAATDGTLSGGSRASGEGSLAANEQLRAFWSS